jgi:hypothetical protein
MGLGDLPSWMKWALFIALCVLLASLLGYWFVYSEGPRIAKP